MTTRTHYDDHASAVSEHAVAWLGNARALNYDRHYVCRGCGAARVTRHPTQATCGYRCLRVHQSRAEAAQRVADDIRERRDAVRAAGYAAAAAADGDRIVDAGFRVADALAEMLDDMTGAAVARARRALDAWRDAILDSDGGCDE